MNQSLAIAAQPDSLYLYCDKLSQADLLPKEYYRKPGNILLAAEYGASIGLPPIQAIQQVHVINGKPSASAALISSLVRRSGHRLRVTGDNNSATAEIVRADDPTFTYTVTFTMQDATNAGLLSNATWKKYPAAMLKARAITAVARDACQEALNGVCYTPEELGADVSAEGAPVKVTVKVTMQETRNPELPQIQPLAAKTPQATQTGDPGAEQKALLARLLRLREEADEVLDYHGDTDIEGTEAQTLIRFRDWTGNDFGKVPKVYREGNPVAVDFASFNLQWLRKGIERYESHKAALEKSEQDAWDAANAVQEAQ